MSLEINGDERVTMYHLRFFGGSHDGEMVNAFRPYHRLNLPDGTVYEATDPDDCQTWVTQV